jgi:hypothetical protein
MARAVERIKQMKDAPAFLKAKGRRIKLLLLFAFCLLPFAFSSSSAHEPITTKVRFNKEVIRILQRNCLSCHHAGGFAPWSFVTYDEARPWAKAIKEEILEKRMPVWHSVRGYGEFRNAPAMTQHEVDLIINWVEGGAPKGDDKDIPKGHLFSTDWQLGRPDLVIKSPEQTVAANADEKRAFTLAELKEDRWVTAADVQPGNGSVVHCVTVYAEKDNRSVVIGTWMPGQRTVALPEGVGQMVAAGSRIVARIHYRGVDAEAKDATSIGLYFAKAAPRKQAREVAITDADATIPAGATAHQVKTSLTIKEDTEAIAIRPRANALMISFQATAIRPDGSQEILIWTRGYRYDWQPTYYFKRAIALPKGTRIEVIAYFDNSENNSDNPNNPPKPISWSDISPEPLCALIMANDSNSSDASGMR